MVQTGGLGVDFTTIVLALVGVVIVGLAIVLAVTLRRNSIRAAKNIERSLKMVPMRIHLPPPTDDVNSENRDNRDVVEETISQAQTMYNIIASTAQKGFKSQLYGQRHIAFEITTKNHLIHYYAVVPTVLTETVKQAVMSAYPNARLEETEENNVFSQDGKIHGVNGGEFVLSGGYDEPIATYQETKNDVMRSIINALSGADDGDGASIQILLRPARENWTDKITEQIKSIKTGKKTTALGLIADIAGALGGPPEEKEAGSSEKKLSGADQEKIERLEEKARHAGFETMIRLVVSSNASSKAQVLMQNIVAVFSLFNSQSGNGLKFQQATNAKQLATDYILRKFPQERTSMVLNTVELSTIFHFPDQSNIPTSAVERQSTKQVDGPSVLPEEGLLLGYNEFRGVQKPIRLQDDDRRRHTYVIGQTGMGKSVFLENLAYQDMRKGLGLAFIDPHGDSAEKLLSLVPENRKNDVIYFNPADHDNPIGLNMFEVDPSLSEGEKNIQIDFIINEMVGMMYSLYDPGHTGIVGPRMENIIRNATWLLLSDPAGATFMDIPKVLRDPAFAKSKLPYLKNATAYDFWTKEWPAAQRSNEAGDVSSWVISKWAQFETVTMKNILGQLHSGINLGEIMNNSKILIVNLSKGALGETESKLLGMLFVMKFQAAAMQRVKIPQDERQDFCLYVDEFQNFATDSFESILSEARKFRLNLIVANQFMTQLTDTIREALIGNVGTVVCGRIGATDAELMVKRFAPVFDTMDLQNTPNYHAVIETLINGTPTAPFTIHLPDPMGTPSKQIKQEIAEASSRKYGRPREIVEAEIKERLAVDEPQPQKATEPAVAPANQQGSFMDNWLQKRQQIRSTAVTGPSQPPVAPVTTPSEAPVTRNPDEISADLR